MVNNVNFLNDADMRKMTDTFGTTPIDNNDDSSEYEEPRTTRSKAQHGQLHPPRAGTTATLQNHSTESPIESYSRQLPANEFSEIQDEESQLVDSTIEDRASLLQPPAIVIEPDRLESDSQDPLDRNLSRDVEVQNLSLPYLEPPLESPSLPSDESHTAQITAEEDPNSHDPDVNPRSPVRFIYRIIQSRYPIYRSVKWRPWGHFRVKSLQGLYEEIPAAGGREVSALTFRLSGPGINVEETIDRGDEVEFEDMKREFRRLVAMSIQRHVLAANEQIVCHLDIELIRDETQVEGEAEGVESENSARFDVNW
jgi:hypothetical protein